MNWSEYPSIFINSLIRTLYTVYSGYCIYMLNVCTLYKGAVYTVKREAEHCTQKQWIQFTKGQSTLYRVAVYTVKREAKHCTPKQWIPCTMGQSTLYRGAVYTVQREAEHCTQKQWISCAKGESTLYRGGQCTLYTGAVYIDLSRQLHFQLLLL